MYLFLNFSFYLVLRVISEAWIWILHGLLLTKYSKSHVPYSVCDVPAHCNIQPLFRTSYWVYEDKSRQFQKKTFASSCYDPSRMRKT